jgi:hypothetical protein
MKRAFTIYYRNDSMELAKVDMAPVFEDCSPLGKADVLKDCLAVVEDLYNEAVDGIPDSLRQALRQEGAE